ncbi:hypothetical protein [Kitasatospora camelliae]|uniref:Uncharacterized protein n=1 Tax=Kitasatospora camelliae TaxID=3156397 RepID=A0AAU8K6A9_9ACTN
MSDQSTAAAAFAAAAIVITPIATAAAQFIQRRWAVNSRDKVKADLELLQQMWPTEGKGELSAHIRYEINHIAWREKNERRNVRGALWSVTLAYIGALALYVEINPDSAKWLTKSTAIIEYAGWAAAFTFIPAGMALFVCFMIKLPRDDRGRVLLYGDSGNEERMRPIPVLIWPRASLTKHTGRRNPG